MIIMAILNGAGQIVKYALSIMGCLVSLVHNHARWNSGKKWRRALWLNAMHSGKKR